MDLKDIFKNIFCFLIESVGFIFIIIAIGYFVLDGTFGKLVNMLVGTL